MHEQIEVLALLQNMDRQIREKTIAKKELLAEIETREKAIEEKRADGGALRAEWEKKDKLRRAHQKSPILGHVIGRQTEIRGELLQYLAMLIVDDCTTPCLTRIASRCSIHHETPFHRVLHDEL